MENIILNTKNKLNSLNNITFKLGFITDVHTGGNNHVDHVAVFSNMVKELNYDLAINGGDIGLDRGEDSNTAWDIINKTKNNMIKDIPFLFCKGNHDFGNTARIPNNEIIKTMYSNCIENYKDNLFLNEKGYGFFLHNDIKIIFLNTSEGDTSRLIVSEDQVNWLIKTLENIKKDEKIIIVSHFCLDIIGAWNSYIDDNYKECFVAIRKILDDFVNRRSGSIYNYKWNFKDNLGKLVCCLSGDSHFNNYTEKNGVRYIVRQGYGGVDPKEMPKGATHDKFSSNDGKLCENYLFDTLVIYDNNNCKIIRSGVGESNRDIIFTF